MKYERRLLTVNFKWVSSTENFESQNLKQKLNFFVCISYLSPNCQEKLMEELLANLFFR